MRIATALESMETNLDRIERNTAPQEQKLPENQDDVEKLFQVHSFYCTRIMDIISDEKSDAFKKAKEFRTLLKESMEALEALSQK